MAAEQLCPICKHKKPVDTEKCAFCGAYFKAGEDPNITTDVAASRSDRVRKQTAPLVQLGQYPPGTLALFMMNEEQPITLQVADRIVLGRIMPDSPQLVFDLSQYGANELGVSRLHALIARTEGAYTITDLGSINGTWVNENQPLVSKRPHPLRSGDTVWLGNFRLRIYFRAGEAVNGQGEETILLVEEPSLSSTPHSPVTVGYLAATLQPYLHALVKLQNIVGSIHGQPSHEVVLHTLSATPPDLPISLSLTGASQAIQIVREIVVPWRSRHANALSVILAGWATRPADAAQPVPALPIPPAADGLQKPALDAAAQMAVSALQEDMRQLAQLLVDHLLPGSSSAEKEALKAKIMPMLGTLATSPLQLLPDKPHLE